MVFRFRMLSDENDHFVRDYEVMYDTTLLEFHNFILDALEYEPCMASFFTADDRWEKQREFYHGVVLGIGVKELLVLSEGDLTVAYGGYSLVAVDNCSIAFTCGRSNAAPYYGKCQHQCQCSCKYLLHYVFFSNLWAF